MFCLWLKYQKKKKKQTTALFPVLIFLDHNMFKKVKYFTNLGQINLVCFMQLAKRSSITEEKLMTESDMFLQIPHM